MQENKYDDNDFFDRYSRMPRSLLGLEGAGEWHELQKMLPDFQGKRVLDLGCGFGWHCGYAARQGAKSVVGIDLSEKMLEQARRKNASPVISYRRLPIEDIEFEAGSFDVIISSLAFHYVADFRSLIRKIHRFLSTGGDVVYSVEHPVFTAHGRQDWHRDAAGTALHWPVDRYFEEGHREAVFLDTPVTKYHRTLTSYLSETLHAGFSITGFCEPWPQEDLLQAVPSMAEELRRPLFLIVSARKMPVPQP